MLARREQLIGTHVVASPEALDRATWDGYDDGNETEMCVRIAHDEAFWIGAGLVHIDDEHAIVEREDGFVGYLVHPGSFRADVEPHIDWQLPVDRRLGAQGKIAGIPAKMWFVPVAAPGDPASVLLVVASAYADDFERRLGW